jgi:pimeloyl-ACP methyl ester carboxylesterase
MQNYILHRAFRFPFRLHVHTHRKGLDNTPTIVFIHGIGASAIMWDDTIEHLPKNIGYVSLDLLGFGKSPKPAWSTYNAYQHAKSLAYTLNRLYHGKPLIVVGHSLGALVAIEYIKHYNDHVVHALLCSPPFHQPAHNISKKPTKIDDQYRKLYRYVRNNPEKFLIGYQKTEKYITKLNKGIHITKEIVPSFMKSLEACIENQSSLQDVTKLSIPIDIIYGNIDLLLVKRNLKYVAKKNKNVRLHSVPSGHEINTFFMRKIIKHLAIAVKAYQAPAHPR